MHLFTSDLCIHVVESGGTKEMHIALQTVSRGKGEKYLFIANNRSFTDGRHYRHKD